MWGSQLAAKKTNYLAARIGVSYMKLGLKRFFKLFSESIPKDFFKHNVNSDLESEKILQGSYLSLSTVTSFGVVMISNA